MRLISIIFFLSINAFISGYSEIFLVGDKDKPELISPGQIVEGPDSNIYVYDEKDAYIKVFSPSGKLFRTIAGYGEGPGYIKRKDAVNFGFTTSECIYISEYFGGHRWISILKKDGSFQEVVNPDLSNTMYGVEQIVALKSGSYIIEFSFLSFFKKRGNFFLHSSPQIIYHMDSKGHLLSKIKETNFLKRISYFKRGADLGLPYTPSSIWTPYEKDTILFTDGMDNVFYILDYKGKIMGHINTELPVVPFISDKDLKKWSRYVKNEMSKNQSGKEWYKKFGKVIEDYRNPVYKKKPYIHSIDRTPAGNFLVSSQTEPGTNYRNFWLLNQEGKILSFSNVNISEIQISSHYIFLKKRDADENIMVYYLKRNKDEKIDLKRLFRILLSR
jgi:hypothetical protein